MVATNMLAITIGGILYTVILLAVNVTTGGG